MGSVMAGFDVHRTQITFDALNGVTGEVVRGRIDATPRAVADWVSRLRAARCTWRWRRARAGSLSARRSRAPGRGLIWPIPRRRGLSVVPSDGPRLIARTRTGCACCCARGGCRSVDPAAAHLRAANADQVAQDARRRAHELAAAHPRHAVPLWSRRGAGAAAQRRGPRLPKRCRALAGGAQACRGRVGDDGTP